MNPAPGVPNRDDEAPAPAVFAEAVMQQILAARWPDGSPLVDVDESVLRRELVCKIQTTAYAFAVTVIMAPSSIGRLAS